MTTPNEPMTDERLAEIRERTEATTPGPTGWSVDAPGQTFYARLGTGGVDGAWPREQIESDQQFIARAREDILALLAEVERLRAQLDDAEEQYKRLQLRCQDYKALLVRLGYPGF